ncbi:MAG TPA: DUF4105 domain-containing protein [Gemmataceae bacterium]|nr:DUF4105 domain-containing protein [Gemmataceae bacterium]
MLKPVRWVLAGLGFLGRLLLVTWATLAIYYSNLPWAWSRLALAVAFAGFSVWALWLTRRPRMGWVFLGLFAAVVVWETSIPPSHDREWRPEVAVLPRAEINGDRVRITGVRDFDFRSTDDFTVRYIDREVSLAHLTSLDLFISYWMPGPVAHTFVSFNFDNAPPVCISIETRPEVGEEFSPVASLFKQYELIYVVGEERDLVRVRTKFRGEEVFLYRIQASSEGVRRLFRIYLDRINELAERPEWYHLLKSNCTINIVRYANAAGREGRWDIRHYLNGWADRYLYAAGRVDTSMPFEELRERSRITDVAQAAGDGPDFSQQIRAQLPGGP